MAIKFTEDMLNKALDNVYGQQEEQTFESSLQKALDNVYGPKQTAEDNTSAVAVENDTVEEKTKNDNIFGTIGAFSESLREGIRGSFENMGSTAQYGSIANNQLADMEKRLQGINITDAQRISDAMKQNYQQAGIDSEYAKQVQKDITDRAQAQGERMSNIQQKYQDAPLADDAIIAGQGIGNILPAMAMGSMFGTFASGRGKEAVKQVARAASSPVFATSVFGSALGEGFQEGGNIGNSGLYATAVAGLETGIEALTGGIAGLGGGVLDPDNLIKTIFKTPGYRFLAKKISDIVGEGGEEVLSELVQPVIKEKLLGKEAEKKPWTERVEDLKQAFKGGALVSAILGVANVGGNVAEYREIKNEITKAGTDANRDFTITDNDANTSEDVQGQGTAVTDDNPDTHTAEQLQKIEEYKTSTDNSMLDFIEKAENWREPQKLNKSVGTVKEVEANAIKRITGVDVSGYTRNVKGDRLIHIIERHDTNGTADKSMANPEDIARMQYVMDNYDEIVQVIDEQGRQSYSKHFSDSDNKKAPLIAYAKAIDGVYYIVEAVPDSNKKILQLESARVLDKSVYHALNGKNYLSADVRNEHGPYHTLSIAQNKQNTQEMPKVSQVGNSVTFATENTAESADLQSTAKQQRAAENLQIVKQLEERGIDTGNAVQELTEVITGEKAKPQADPKVVEKENARVAAIEETARQGIATQEDVQKVKAAAQHNIQQNENKAVVTQKFGDEEIGRIEELAKLKGYKVVYEADESDSAQNGYIQDGTIYINAAGNSPYFNVAVHEVLHGMKGNTAEWSKLEKAVFRLIGSDGDMTKFADNVVATYTENSDSAAYKSLLTNGQLDNAKLNEEIVANFVEEYLPKIAANEDALIAEIKKDRTLIDGLLDIIRGIKNNLAIKFTKSEKAMLDEAERNLVNLLRAESREVGQKRYSVEYDINNKPYVVVAEDILANVPKSQWVQKVKDALSSRSILMDNFAIAINSTTRGEFTRSKYTGNLRAFDYAKYADKMRMSNNIDEIVRNAYGTQNENAKHNNFPSFNRSYIDVRIGNNDYSVEVVTGISKNNEEILYDIVKIQPTQIKRRNTPVGASKSSKNVGNISSTNTIPQTVNNINGKNQSGSGAKFSQPVAVYDGETAKSRGIRKTAVYELADSLGVMFGITDRNGKEGLRNEAYRIADQVEKFGFITKANMDNFFDAAYNAARLTDEKADYASLKKRIHEAGIEPLGGREYLDFLQEYKGKIKFKRGGLPIDVLYQELSENYPEYFPKDVINPYDQMQVLGEVYDSLRRKEMSVDEYYGNGARQFRAEAYDRYARQVDLFVDKINSVSRYKKANVDRKAAKDRQRGRRPKTYTLEDVQKAHKQAEQISKEINKLMADTALTDDDKSLLEDLLKIKNQRVLAATLKDMQDNNPNAKVIYKLYNLKQELTQVKEPIREFSRVNREKNRGVFMELLTTSKSWKEKHRFGGLRYKAETFERIIDDVVTDKKAAEQLKDMLPRSIHRHVAEGNRYKNELRDRVRRLNLDREKLYEVEFENKNNQIIAGEMTESGLVQIYGEGLVGKEYLDKIGADVEKITAAAEEFRKIYNEMIEKINEAYVRNGYKPIEFRKDYFPHFMEDGTDTLLNKMTSWFGIDAMSKIPAGWQRGIAKLTVKDYTEGGMLPTEIAGTTYKRSPGRKWNAHALQRQGENTVYDALKGFDNYLETAADVIFLTDDIQNLRSFEDTIRYKFSDNGIQEEIEAVDEMEDLSPQEKWTRKKEIYEDKNRNKYLNNFVSWLHNYTNLLAGKKDFSDRVWEENLGRGIYQMSKDMESRVAANMVAGNISSALTNVIPIAQMTARVNEKYVLAAMRDTVKNMGKSNDGFAFQSDFLTNRFGSERLVDDSLAKKLENVRFVGDVLGIMETVDEFTSNVVVRGKYMQNINEGMTHEVAMKSADEFAASLMADRSKGALPTVFETKNPVTKAITMFQVEQNNQLQYLLKDLLRSLGDKDEIGKALTMAILKYSLYSWLYNLLYEQIAGRKPAFSPIDLIASTGRDFYRVAKGEMKTSQAVSNTIVNVAEELPFAAAPLGMLGLSDDAGRLPISGALPDFANVLKLFDSEVAWEKKKSILYKERSKPMYYLLFPVAGGQVKKTGEAMYQMIANDGVSYYTNNSGSKNVQFAVDASNPFKLAQSAVFGRWSTKEARDYVEGGFDYLSKSESRMFEYLKGIGIDTAAAYEQVAGTKSRADTDGNGYLKTSEVVRYLDSTGMSKQDKANLFAIMCPNVKNNPYKE